MGFERMHGNGNGSGLIYDHEERENGGENSPRVASLKVFPVSSSSTSASSSSSSSSSPRRYIEHHVTKYDTLAGIAIRYGVEVADIKKMNGLVTDLQMFGLKTLQIPLPGRHPPSPCLTNGHGTSGSKAASRTNLASDAEVGGTNGLPPLPGDTAVADSSSAVRKSSSTSSLQEQDNNSTSSIWSSLKPDIQAALGKPLFDGLSKPITGRRAKAALD
ncbi:hypothetical protein Cgig2_017411 [Carnegiea gigantea]|uniref:LysM domain-containing protein n=1 Tax=Carnegiea gigantea TaxID=171969 RepID=A0A9Q1JXY1_9CARY|nr:hypothetical protein Cgig2_017411 [Carnegiea gigantea]